MRLLYVKAPDCESDLRTIRQLARLTSDKKITSVKTTAAAINVLRKAPPDKRFDGLVTSPALDDAALLGLVHEILRGGPLVSLIPVVLDADQSLRAFKAGADVVLLQADGALVDAVETLRTLDRRFKRPTNTPPAAAETPAVNGSSVLVDLLKFQKYFSRSAPREPITVEVARYVDDELIQGAARLVPQLSSSARVPGPWELDEIIKTPGTTLIVAREGRAVVGMLTLHTFRAATGIHAWIQDLVVDKHAKGRGVSELLTREAVQLGVLQGARTAELTSRPSRLGTGRLYERLGFERRETHLYRYRLSS